MKAVEIHEAHRPGWEVVFNDREWMIWAPREAVDHGVSVSGTPMVSPGRARWAASLTEVAGDPIDFWRADSFEELVKGMPLDVQAAFRGAVQAEGLVS